jgi:hypothetical protein
MMRKDGPFVRHTSLPRLIWLGTGLHLSIALLSYLGWMATENELWITAFFRYQGAIFLLLCSGAGAWLSLAVWRRFSPGDAMKSAWFLILLSFLCRFSGDLLANLFSANSNLNPRHLLDGLVGAWDDQAAQATREIGLVIGGPGSMVLLAGGLLLVLRLYWRLGLLARLKALDYALAAAVTAYTLRFTYDLLRWLGESPAPVTPLKAIIWLSDPLLSLLLFEAIFIRRSVIQMGSGLISRCWGAFTAGIFFTSVGDMGLWAIAQGYLTWPQSSITWYVWFLASAAYALGPAYQAEAMSLATKEAARPVPEERVEFA